MITNTTTTAPVPGTLHNTTSLKTLVPVIHTCIGSLPVDIGQRIHAGLAEHYQANMNDLPVAFRLIDSAEGSRDKSVASHGSGTNHPANVHIYEGHSIPALRTAHARRKETAHIADKLAKVVNIQDGGSAHGCNQQPEYGLAQYGGNFPMAERSQQEAVLRVRSIELINRCELRGIRVRSGRKVRSIRWINAAGSTGNGAECADALVAKALAAQSGIGLENHAMVVMPSASTSADPIAARENAGKLILEMMRAVQDPKSIEFNALDGRVFRYDQPVYDTITLVSIGNDYRAAGSRDDLAARLALLGVMFSTTAYLEQSAQAFADSMQSMADTRLGFPFIRSLWLARRFSDSRRNAAIASGEAAAVLSKNL